MADSSSSMPGPGPGPSRRTNGLPSSEWGALVDLDPRLSENLLASLGAADVPAFVEPANGTDALSRAAQHPGRPLDRLWVDPLKADAARAVVAAEVADLSRLLAESEPGATAYGFVQPVPRTAAARVLSPPALPDPPARRVSAPRGEEGPRDAPGVEPDPDEQWRAIVEGYDRDVQGPVTPWPVSEDLDPPARLRPGSRPLGRPERSGESDTPVPRRRRQDAEPLPTWVEPEALEDEGHYVPPPPPPVPRLAPQKLGAAAAVLLGCVLMFVPGVLLQPRTPGVAVFGLLATVLGAGALVYLMRDAHPEDRGPDDGAVV